METQNYSNHKRYFAPHHFIYLPLLGFLQIFGIWKAFRDEPNQTLWILFSTVIFLLIYLALMLRQHYALVLQNRIVCLEFKQRYFELYGKRSDPVEAQLEFGQLAALRFTYDDEFRVLLDETLKNNISADQIKKSIKVWRPDLRRV